jgi:hypothetical protein
LFECCVHFDYICFVWDSVFKIVKSKSISLYLFMVHPTHSHCPCFQLILLSSFSRLKPLLSPRAIISCRPVIHQLVELILSTSATPARTLCCVCVVSHPCAHAIVRPCTTPHTHARCCPFVSSPSIHQYGRLHSLKPPLMTGLLFNPL